MLKCCDEMKFGLNGLIVDGWRKQSDMGQLICRVDSRVVRKEREGWVKVRRLGPRDGPDQPC